MRSKKVKVNDGSGNLVQGTLVDINESIERFSELRLADGTIMKVKVNVIQAIRLDGRNDADGNPVYVIKNSVVASVESSSVVGDERAH